MSNVEFNLKRISPAREIPSNHIAMPIIFYSSITLLSIFLPIFTIDHKTIIMLESISFFGIKIPFEFTLVLLVFSVAMFSFVKYSSAAVKYHESFSPQIAELLSKELNDGEKFLGIQTGANHKEDFYSLKNSNISLFGTLVFTTRRVIIIQYKFSINGIRILKRIAKKGDLKQHVHSIHYINLKNKDNFRVSRYNILNPIFFTASILNLKDDQDNSFSWLLQGRHMKSGKLLRQIERALN